MCTHILPDSLVHGQRSRQRPVQIRSLPDGATRGQRFPHVTDQRSTPHAPHDFSSYSVCASITDANTIVEFLCRTILYPKLEDNEIVKDYPDVKGMSQNVVFFTHNHKENGGQDSVSKVNSFEVRIRTVGICSFSEWNSPGQHDRGSSHVLPTARRVQRPR